MYSYHVSVECEVIEETIHVMQTICDDVYVCTTSDSMQLENGLTRTHSVLQITVNMSY